MKREKNVDEEQNLVPNLKNLHEFGCVKAPGLRHRNLARIALILTKLRCLNRGSFHVSPTRKNFQGWVLGKTILSLKQGDVIKYRRKFLAGGRDGSCWRVATTQKNH